MQAFKLEHSPGAYVADFFIYGALSVLLAGFLLLASSTRHIPGLLAQALGGLATWSLVEYLLHRFVLHGLRPFSRWHEEHHQRPLALICTPTIWSLALMLLLVFVPAMAWLGIRSACALTWGLSTGYLVYALTHHAVHHGRGHHAWLKHQRRRHALHHSPQLAAGHYGVTSSFWDHVFGSHRVLRVS